MSNKFYNFEWSWRQIGGSFAFNAVLAELHFGLNGYLTQGMFIDPKSNEWTSRPMVGLVLSILWFRVTLSFVFAPKRFFKPEVSPVQQGLVESAHGKTSDLGSFSEYAREEHEEALQRGAREDSVREG